MKKHCLTTQEIQQKLTEVGIQPTLQRISICSHVLCEADHPTAEDVHAWAEKNLAKISLATTYNTLNTLVEAGLLKAFRFPHSEKVFYDNNLEDHYHFLDERTNKLYDIEKEALSVEPSLAKNYKINEIEVLLKGEFKNDKK